MAEQTERRRSADKERGVMEGQIQGIMARQDREATTLTDWIEQHETTDKEEHAAILAEVKGIRDDMSMYKHFWLFLKTAALIGAAVMTFKFGDITALWRIFMDG